MSKQSISFFLPVRKGSERVINKNTRPFSTYKNGLLELKLKQLQNSRLIDEIIVSTNDERCLEIAEEMQLLDPRIKAVKRPDHLGLGSTNLVDLIDYVPTLAESEHILWGHVTTPFVTEKEYDEAIQIFHVQLQKGYDSLCSVKEFRNYLLNEEGKVVNNNLPIKWPRTQDLSPLYELNHAMFIAPREVYLKERDRLGDRPFLHKMQRIHSIDIDWLEDFLVAEALFEKNIIENDGISR